MMQLLDRPALVCGTMTLDVDHRLLSGPRGHLTLAPRYFALMERLMRRPGVIVSHSDLIAATYPEPDDEPEDVDLSLRKMISRARILMEALGGTQREIVSEPGVGYRMSARAR